MDTIKELLKDYHAVIQLPVQWGDMDIGHHVNNVVYLRYMESGRVAYLQEISDITDFKTVAPVVAEINVKYKLPVRFPDTLSIGTRVLELDEYSMLMETVIVSHQWQKITTTAQVRIVSFDFQAQKKAPIPTHLKKRVIELENLTV